MINFFTQSNLENKNCGLELVYEKKLTKLEKSFLSFLIEIHNKEEEFSSITIKELCSRIKLKKADFRDFIRKFSSKRISYSIYNEGETLAEGSFYILSSYLIQNETLIFSLAREIKYSYEKNNIFNKINLHSILKFNIPSSLSIYLLLLNSDKNNIEFSIEEFRDKLSTKNSYSRYYDLEKYILTPISEDINNFTEFELEFSKIKKSSGKSARVTGINLSFYNRVFEDKKKRVNELLTLLKDYISSFDICYNIIYQALSNYSDDYVYENLLYAKENFESNSGKIFEDFLKISLSENLEKKHRKTKNINEVIIKKKLSNHIQLHEEINTSLLKFNSPELLNPNLVGPKFYRDLHKLKDGENISFENEHIRISIFYHSKKESEIKISIV